MPERCLILTIFETPDALQTPSLEDLASGTLYGNPMSTLPDVICILGPEGYNFEGWDTCLTRSLYNL